MDIKQFLAEQNIFIRWVSFGSYGMTIGLPIAYVIAMTSDILSRDLYRTNSLGDLISLGVFAIITGTFLGYFQSVALNRQVVRPLSWILASSIGLTVGIVCVYYLEVNFNLIETTVDSLAAGAVIGLTLGFTQWLVLRSQIIKSGLWILGSLVGAVLGTIIINPLMTLADLLDSFFWNDFGMILGLVFLFFFSPFVIGFFYNLSTGIIMNWLLNIQTHESQKAG